MRRIAISLDRDVRQCAVDVAEIAGEQLDVRRREVLLETVQLRGTGIGTIHGRCASSQAIAICAGVARFLLAIWPIRSMRAGSPYEPRA
jgi:hypothetical protein